jgi:hypothetical protein
MLLSDRRPRISDPSSAFVSFVTGRWWKGMP